MKTTFKQVRELLGLEIGDKVEIEYYGEWTVASDYEIKDSRGAPLSIFFLLEKEYEIVRPILDDIEKRYLENVLRPFKNNKNITITKDCCFSDVEYIVVRGDDLIIDFPQFETDTMYKGMELFKKYTMKELGLFKK